MSCGFQVVEVLYRWRNECERSKTTCSTILLKLAANGWSIVRSASLAKEGTSKKRPSLHLHKVLTRSNKASP
jgi:hypothetical protein